MLVLSPCMRCLQVVEGLEVVQLVESKGSSSGKTAAEIKIADCGQL